MDLQEDVDRIVLIIGNRQPVAALAVSELLAALARDYRKQNRARTLVISRVEDGSILITLLDMAQTAMPYAKGVVEAAKGGKAIIDFGKSLTGLLKAKKDGQGSVEQSPSNAPERSIEKIVKLAVEADCNVRIQQIEADGSRLEVEVTRSEAVAIQERDHYAKEANKLSQVSVAYLRDSDAKRAAKIVDDFERLQLSDKSTDNDALQVIISTLKRAGDDRLLESLAIELEARGFKHLAATFRGN